MEVMVSALVSFVLQVGWWVVVGHFAKVIREWKHSYTTKCSVLTKQSDVVLWSACRRPSSPALKRSPVNQETTVFSLWSHVWVGCGHFLRSIVIIQLYWPEEMQPSCSEVTDNGSTGLSCPGADRQKFQSLPQNKHLAVAQWLVLFLIPGLGEPFCVEFGHSLHVSVSFISTKSCTLFK